MNQQKEEQSGAMWRNRRELSCKMGVQAGACAAHHREQPGATWWVVSTFPCKQSGRHVSWNWDSIWPRLTSRLTPRLTRQGEGLPSGVPLVNWHLGDKQLPSLWLTSGSIRVHLSTTIVESLTQAVGVASCIMQRAVCYPDHLLIIGIYYQQCHRIVGELFQLLRELGSL